MLVPLAALAIWILRREGGAWHAVGALWPGTQFYYNSMALPAIAHRNVLTACLALPVPLMAPLVVIALAARKVMADRDSALPRPTKLLSGNRRALDEPAPRLGEDLGRDRAH